MGVESGGKGGRVPRSQKISGDVPQTLRYFSIFFLETYINFAFMYNNFEIKGPKSEEKLHVEGVVLATRCMPGKGVVW